MPGKVVYLSSDSSFRCPHCDYLFGLNDDIGIQINHFLDHGYKLCHVGTETSRVDEGLWHRTIAIMEPE